MENPGNVTRAQRIIRPNESKRYLQRISKLEQESIKTQSQKVNKKLTGPIFWLMVGFGGAVDLLNVVLLFAGGSGLLINRFVGFGWAFIVFLYLLFSGVKITTRKVATWSISTLVEMIPVIGTIAPMSALNLVLIRSIENNEKIAKIINVAHKRAS